MRSGIGQCYSMPLYYLILTETMGAEAYWAQAPHHGFVKIKDENNAWYNIELTCSAILSDAHYVNHNYIKAEAIRSKLYLNPLDKKDIISDLLSNLARYYHMRYGYDNFFLQCINTVLQYSPNNLTALMFKYEYERELIQTFGYLVETRDINTLIAKIPKADKHLEELKKVSKQITSLGYEDTPPEVYAVWKEHIAKQKGKVAQHKTILLNF